MSPASPRSSASSSSASHLSASPHRPPPHTQQAPPPADAVPPQDNLEDNGPEPFEVSTIDILLSPDFRRQRPTLAISIRLLQILVQILHSNRDRFTRPIDTGHLTTLFKEISRIVEGLSDSCSVKLLETPLTPISKHHCIDSSRIGASILAFVSAKAPRRPTSVTYTLDPSIEARLDSSLRLCVRYLQCCLQVEISRFGLRVQGLPADHPDIVSWKLGQLLGSEEWPVQTRQDLRTSVVWIPPEPGRDFLDVHPWSRGVVRLKLGFRENGQLSWTTATGCLVKQDVVMLCGHHAFKGPGRHLLHAEAVYNVLGKPDQSRYGSQVVLTWGWYGQHWAPHDVALIRVSKSFSKVATPQIRWERAPKESVPLHCDLVGYPKNRSIMHIPVTSQWAQVKSYNSARIFTCKGAADEAMNGGPILRENKMIGIAQGTNATGHVALGLDDGAIDLDRLLKAFNAGDDESPSSDWERLWEIYDDDLKITRYRWQRPPPLLRKSSKRPPRHDVDGGEGSSRGSKRRTHRDLPRLIISN